MTNIQLIERAVYREDGALEIVGKPFLTIQGEGPAAGTPAVFIRLAGCNLQCGPCDTDYTTDRRLLDLDQLTREILMLQIPPPWTRPIAVITGGEPFRQDLNQFVNRLRGIVSHVQIETNGTLPPRTGFYWNPQVEVICSPKTEINPKMIERIDYLKYVVVAGKIDSEDGLPTESILGVRPGRIKNFPASSIYIQPCDPGRPEVLDNICQAFYEHRIRENVRAAVESCLKFGYRLSLQTHKIAGLE